MTIAKASKLGRCFPKSGLKVARRIPASVVGQIRECNWPILTTGWPQWPDTKLYIFWAPTSPLIKFHMFNKTAALWLIKERRNYAFINNLIPNANTVLYLGTPSAGRKGVGTRIKVIMRVNEEHEIRSDGTGSQERDSKTLSASDMIDNWRFLSPSKLLWWLRRTDECWRGTSLGVSWECPKLYFSVSFFFEVYTNLGDIQYI